VKYANFQQVTRAQSVERVLDGEAIKQWIPQLLQRTDAGSQPIRLVGLSLSNLEKSDGGIAGLGGAKQQLALV